IVGDYIIGPEFIQGNVNADYYANFLLHEFDEYLKDVLLANRLEIIFQDRHPAHTSILTKIIL
ncbi:hypothetical protein EAG_05745, partial [Camponotus floridanus]